MLYILHWIATLAARRHDDMANAVLSRMLHDVNIVSILTAKKIDQTPNHIVLSVIHWQ